MNIGNERMHGIALYWMVFSVIVLPKIKHLVNKKCRILPTLDSEIVRISY